MSQTPSAPPSDRRILRLAEVEARTGFKRAHIYNLMRAEEFPRRVRLGLRAVGWDSVEVDAWVAGRLRERV